MVEPLVGGRLERRHLEAGRIHPGEYVPDRPVLPAGIHRLKDEEHCISVVGIELPLKLVDFLGPLLAGRLERHLVGLA